MVSQNTVEMQGSPPGDSRAALLHNVETGRTMDDKDGCNQNKRKNILYTDKIIKCFVCIFYGIIPCLFAVHTRKLCSFFLPMCVLLLQWYAVAGYVYCTKMFWSQPSKRGNNTDTINHDSLRGPWKGPKMPLETALLLLGLVTSGAITVTMAIYYFYSKNNNFLGRRRGDFTLIPKISYEEDGDGNIDDVTSLSDKEWLVVNSLFASGITNVFFILGADFGTDTMFDFYGIRAFLDHTTVPNRAVYSISVSMLFWGFGGTVCACCIFHIMSRRLVAAVTRIQSLILSSEGNRKHFLKHHKRLIAYTEAMINKFKHWFVVHNAMFVCLVAAMLFEWFTFMKRSRFGKINILAQVAGTILICYKFAFPFISASRVTVAFSDFYMNVFRSNKFDDIPELLILENHFGFTLFGWRVTTSTALLVLLSSLVGILKFASADLF